MLLPVHEHVDEGVAHLSRGGERSNVVPLGPQPSATAQDPVDGDSRTAREALHPAGERLAVVGLGDQMNVILLDREDHGAKGDVRGGSYRVNDRGQHLWGAQATERAIGPQGDDERVA